MYAGEHRLGSTAAALKLKGIDGGPHKQWSMGLNAMIRAKPYQPFHHTSSGDEAYCMAVVSS